MKCAKLGHTSHALKSDPQGRTFGRTIRAILINEVENGKADPLSLFMERSLRVPCSLDTYEALRRLAIRKPRELLNSEWLPLNFSVGGEQIIVPIPNFALGLPQESISAFRAFMSGETALKTGFLKFALNNRKNDVLRALEAVLHEHWSPVLISVAGGRFHTAQPRYIDLLADAIPMAKSRARRRNCRVDIISRYIVEIQGFNDRKSKRSYTAKFCWAHRRSSDLIERIYVYGILKIVGGKKHNPETTVRYLNGLRMALATLVHDVRINDRVCAYGRRRIERRFNNLSTADKEELKVRVAWTKREQNVNKDIPLIPPNLIEARYKYDPVNPPFKESISKRARHILNSILFQSGRRATCLRNLLLSDFMEMDEDFYIIIDRSKTSASGKNRLPVDWIWPKSEIEHLRDFLHTVRATFAPHSHLLEIAGIDSAGSLAPKRLHSKVYNLLGRVPTHVPRKLFATWWPVRVLCSRCPALLSHPLMRKVKRHPWFSPDGLLRLAKGLESEQADSMEIGARILGHSSTFELLDTYCQSWPLLMALAGSR